MSALAAYRDQGSQVIADGLIGFKDHDGNIAMPQKAWQQLFGGWLHDPAGCEGAVEIPGDDTVLPGVFLRLALTAASPTNSMACWPSVGSYPAETAILSQRGNRNDSSRQGNAQWWGTVVFQAYLQDPSTERRDAISKHIGPIAHQIDGPVRLVRPEEGTFCHRRVLPEGKELRIAVGNESVALLAQEACVLQHLDDGTTRTMNAGEQIELTLDTDGIRLFTVTASS